MHSRVRGVLICLGIFAGCSINARLTASPGGPVWWSARGGTREPGGWYQRTVGAAYGRCIVFITSCSQPYMLDDCCRSFAALGYRSERRAFWFDWSLLYHPLFREDTISLVLGARILNRSWILAVRPVLHRVAVKGFPRQMSYSYGYSCSYMHGQRGGIGIEGYAVRGYGAVPGGVTGVVSIRTGALGVVVNMRLGGARRRDGTIGIELDAGGGLALLSGYDTGTDEISAGVVYRTGAYLIGAGWSDHESLGTTITFGVGRLWRR